MQREIEALRCVYCLQLIDTDDAAQKVSKSEYAHTACGWRVNDAFFAMLDFESERDDDKK